MSTRPPQPEHEHLKHEHLTCYGECDGGQVGQRWPEAEMRKWEVILERALCLNQESPEMCTREN